MQRRNRNLNLSKQQADQTIARLRIVITDRSDKIAQLEITSRKLQSDNRQLQDDCVKQQKGFESIEADYNCILERLIKPYATNRKIEFQGVTDTSIKRVIDPMLRDANQSRTLWAEVRRLRTQVGELQQDMLAKVDKVEAISDDQFAKEFRSLASTIKTFSRSIRFDTQINVSELVGELVLVSDVAPHHWSGRARKKPLAEAWIWSILVSLVFHNPYTIFGDHCAALNEAWLQIYGAEHLFEWPSPSSRCELWRVKAVEQLLEQTSPETITHGESGVSPAVLTASVIELRQHIASTICSHFELVAPGFKGSDIQLIIDKAFSLALHIFLQRSRFQVTFPAIGADFHESQMLSVDDDDDGDIKAGVVAFIINPGLTKWGDAHGEHYDHCNDIVPALVQLEPKDLGLNFDDYRQEIVDAEPIVKQEYGVKQEAQWSF